MSLQSADPGHQPRTVQRLVRCGYPRVGIWSCGTAAFSRAGTGFFMPFALLSLRPFPKSARAAIYRDRHVRRSFMKLTMSINGDDAKDCEVEIVLRGKLGAGSTVDNRSSPRSIIYLTAPGNELE